MSEARCGWVLLDAAALPADDAFLSPAERARAAGMRVASRRQDFRLGRLAARRALGAWLKCDEPGAEIEILAAASGAPEVMAPPTMTPGGDPAPAISISHRAGRALCAIAGPGVALGADLEQLEPRSEALIDQFFTAEEQRLVLAAGPAARILRANLIWSAKESAAKALREGLRLDTRTLEVQLPGGPPREGWRRLRVCTPAGILEGYWRRERSLVITVAAREGLAPPEQLSR